MLASPVVLCRRDNVILLVNLLGRPIGRTIRDLRRDPGCGAYLPAMSQLLGGAAKYVAGKHANEFAHRFEPEVGGTTSAYAGPLL